MSWLSNLFTPENVIGVSSMAGQGFMNFYQQQQANEQNYRMHKENLAWSRESQRLAQQYNTQMWQMNNQWNSPANQMALLRGAGLNPNLAYGNAFGNASAPQINSQTASDGHPMQAPQMSGLENVWSNLLQDKQLDQQQKLIDSEVKLNEANAEKTEKESGVFDQKFEMFKQRFAADLKNLNANYEKTMAEAQSFIEQFKVWSSEAKLNEAKAFSELLDNLIKGKAMDDIIKSYGIHNQYEIALTKMSISSSLYYTAMANSINLDTSIRRTLKKFEIEGRKAQYNTDVINWYVDKYSMWDRAKQPKLQNMMTDKQIQLLGKDSDWYGINKISNVTSSIMPALGMYLYKGKLLEGRYMNKNQYQRNPFKSGSDWF